MSLFDQIAQLNPWLIVAIFCFFNAALYFSRDQIHRLITIGFQAFAKVLKQAARVLIIVNQRINERNKSVLLEMGKWQFERRINQEFQQVENILKRDLEGYPELQQKIFNLIQSVEDDYRKSGEVPPNAPDWVDAVKAIAQLQETQKGNPVLVRVLEDLHHSIQEQHSQTNMDYRGAVSRRHRLLHAMMPHWRKLNSAVSNVGDTVRGLIRHAQDIDKYMITYQDICKGSLKAERMLKVSTLSELFKSTLFLGVLAAGAYINFNLIVAPMGEMVGVANDIGGYSLASISAFVVILIEMTVGVFLMDSLRITHLFPVFGVLDEKMRRIVVTVLLFILILLAGFEASLAFMRDQVVSHGYQTANLLSGVAVEIPEAQNVNQLIPMYALMLVGFILPLALTFIAVPLESFIVNLRLVLAQLLALILRGIALVLRMLSSLLIATGKILIALYDVVVFVPLAIERGVNKNNTEKPDVENSVKPIVQPKESGDLNQDSEKAKDE